MNATGKKADRRVLLDSFVFLLIGFFVVACLSCGGSSGGDGDGDDTAPTPYGVEVSLSGQFSWDPGNDNITASLARMGSAGRAASRSIQLVANDNEGFELNIIESNVVDGVARLKTQVTNLADPDDIMINVIASVTSIEGQDNITNDGPWEYGILDNNTDSDMVEWCFSNVDSQAAFTVYFSLTWTREENENIYSEFIITSDYGGKYYIVDPLTGSEIIAVEPDSLDSSDLRDVTLGYLGQRTFFTSKKGTSHHQLYACDTLTGDNLQKLTDFDHEGMANPDGNPANNSIVFEGVQDGGIVNLFIINEEGSLPLQITGDEQLAVPEADDPTENWNSKSPAWSPDGNNIAYVRTSKDSEGSSWSQFDAIVVMSADGSGKIVIHAETGTIQNLCWNFDGTFLIYTNGQTNAQDKKVAAVHVESGEVSDLSNTFSADVNGMPASLWSSPGSNAFAYTPIEVNPDLYIATLSVNNNTMSVDSLDLLNGENHHYRWPDWSFARRATSSDNVSSYGNQEESPTGQIIVSGNYASKYYVIDADSGDELFNINPGVFGVQDVSIGNDGTRVYFAAKSSESAFFELFGCDTLTGGNLEELTSLGKIGLKNIDANPVDNSIIFESPVDSKKRIFIMTDEDADPIRISGDENLEVPGADDPTVSWDDNSPSWSPDGQSIAYIRGSKDVTGDNQIYFQAIVIMDKDGNDKNAIYAEEGAVLRNLCWTHDGEFLIFTKGFNNDANKLVRAVHITTGEVSELTASFADHSAGTPASLWVAPSRFALVFAPIKVNPDFYVAELSKTGNSLSVDSITKLTQDKKHYRCPDWAAIPAP